MEEQINKAHAVRTSQCVRQCNVLPPPLVSIELKLSHRVLLFLALPSSEGLEEAFPPPPPPPVPKAAVPTAAAAVAAAPVAGLGGKTTATIPKKQWKRISAAEKKTNLFHKIKKVLRAKRQIFFITLNTSIIGLGQ